MARRQHHNSISLFPFLAVLVCAMGSLILLLLVMTRKMHNDQEKDAAAAVMIASDLSSQTDRVAEIADLEAQIRMAQITLSSLQSQSAAINTSVGERQQQIVTLNDELAGLQEQLRKCGGGETIGVSETLKEARELKAKEAALLRQLKESERLLYEKQQLLTNADDASKEAELVLQEKHSDLIRLRAQVEDAKTKAATVSGTATLLEFSNSTGTSRTPIVVDVTEKGFEILPNEIRITAAEMEGFPVKDNPFLSAVLTAHRFRSGNSVTDEPYVLLLVRPDGSLPFYAAQKILMESGVHFGYELLEPDQTIVAGEVDPAEVPAVQQSIQEALRRRENMYAKLMAIAQQNGSLPGPDGQLQSGANARRLTVRPDGRVMMDEGPSRRPLDGRFYAGGVAPPPSLMQNRPAGGYRGLDPDRMTAADAEKLADEFAARYAKQQAVRSSEATFSETPGPTGPSSMPPDGTDSLRSPGEKKFADSMFGSDGSLQSAAVAKRAAGSNAEQSARETDQTLFAGTTTQKTDTKPAEDYSFASSLASTNDGRLQKTNPSSIPVTPEESLLASGQANNLPSTGSPDLSKVDPDLLKRLNGGKKAPNSLSTPVGVTVFLDEHHMTVGQQSAVEIDASKLDAAFVTLLTGINTEVSDADLKPNEPVMPIVKFVVSPGGERWRISLSRSLKGSGIRSATVYELTPYMAFQDSTGRAKIKNDEMN